MKKKIREENLKHSGKLYHIAKQQQKELTEGNMTNYRFLEYLKEWESCTKDEQEDWSLNGRK